MNKQMESSRVEEDGGFDPLVPPPLEAEDQILAKTEENLADDLMELYNETKGEEPEFEKA